MTGKNNDDAVPTFFKNWKVIRHLLPKMKLPTSKMGVTTEV